MVVDKYNFLRVTKLDAIIKSTEGGGGQEDIVHQFTNPSVLDHTAYILIAIGGFIFIISFLGYCGSLQESRVLLTSYGLFLIIIFILQIAGIICCVVYRKQADDQVRKGLKFSITNSYTTKDYRDPITLTWDLVMSNMECCGVNNYTDFLEAKRFVSASREEGLGRKVPEACCILQGDPALLRPADDNCIVSPSTANSYLFKVLFGQLSKFICKMKYSGMLRQVSRDYVCQLEYSVRESHWTRSCTVCRHRVRFLYLQKYWFTRTRSLLPL